MPQWGYHPHLLQHDNDLNDVGTPTSSSSCESLLCIHIDYKTRNSNDVLVKHNKKIRWVKHIAHTL